MENKYVKYVLIIAVLAIWATIIYRIITGLKGPQEAVISERFAPKKQYRRIEDSFNLYVDYPDPFLGSSDSVLVDTITKKSSSLPLDASTRPVTPNTADVIATIVQYNGIISNPKSRSKVAIVTIHGKEYLVREKDKVNEIRFLKIEKGKLSIIYKGEIFTINK